MMLRTARLRLRRWIPSDLEAFAALNRDPEVMRYFPALRDRAESAASIERIEASFEANSFGFWAMELPGAGFIGLCGLAVPGFTAHFTPCVEIGWRMAREHWGQGYASEAARAIAVGWVQPAWFGGGRRIHSGGQRGLVPSDGADWHGAGPCRGLRPSERPAGPCRIPACTLSDRRPGENVIPIARDSDLLIQTGPCHCKPASARQSRAASTVLATLDYRVAALLAMTGTYYAAGPFFGKG